MQKTFYSLSFILLMLSCTETNDNIPYQDVELQSQESTIVEDELKVNSFEEERIFGSLEIMFSEFDFTIYNSSFYETRTVSISSQDTVSTYLELGEYLDSATIEIHHDGTHNIEIYQMYENSITIMNEGPHCDLINWKHYHSKWVKIKKYNDYDFVAETYTEEDWDKFLDIEVKELHNAVLEHCGEEWAELVNDIENYNEYPSGISMNKIFFKVVLTNKSSGEKTEQIITIEIAMGC